MKLMKERTTSPSQAKQIQDQKISFLTDFHMWRPRIWFVKKIDSLQPKNSERWKQDTSKLKNLLTRNGIDFNKILRKEETRQRENDKPSKLMLQIYYTCSILASFQAYNSSRREIGNMVHWRSEWLLENQMMPIGTPNFSKVSDE